MHTAKSGCANCEGEIMKRNPFKFGVVVDGDDFCDRGREIEELLSDIKSGIHVTIISPRRYGKTSLIKNLFNRVDFAQTFYVDLMGITTLEAFLSTYTTAILTGLGKRKKVETLVRKFLPKVDGIQITLGTVGFSLRIAPTANNVEEVLSITERLDKPVIIALDEFQEILNIQETDLLAILRKNAQFFKNTILIFSGSKRHVMRDIFLNHEKPFYRFSKVLSLGLLDKGEASNFIKRKFDETGFDIPYELCNKICDICSGHPFYIQYLAHILWNTISFKSNKLKKVCTHQDLELATESILIGERAMFELVWDSLTPIQRMVLKNLAVGKSAYELKISSRSVKRALENLENLDIIEKCERGYRIVDPFLKIWLVRMSAGR
uniref:ATP-binding protein n=1 Tax=Fervidobacterium thailandense TaxID=1008305 RepID=A0A7C4VU01_9BACT